MKALTWLCSLFACAVSLAVQAQTPTAPKWPDKPVHLVVPFAPGGNIDIAARLVSNRLQEILGQSFVIDNKPGGGGLLAGELVARSPADGYTIFVGANGPLLFSPITTGRPAFEWRRDFSIIGPISFTPMVLIVQPSIEANSLRDFIALAKQRPLFMGTGGAGSTNHLVGELLQETTGARWTTVHYRGNAPTMNALLTGEINFSLEQITAAGQYVKDGKVRALGATSTARLPLLPDVPTFEEQGFRDFEATTFSGLFAPSATPPAVVDRLAEALARVTQEPEVARRFVELGSETRPMSRSAFEAYLGKVEDTWLPVIKRTNVKAD